ncbi:MULTISPECIES: MATE family efflux transporter [unclassified Nocardioides]|uniref:MATE family efflux transporter n=1 Tax=unclassified Nocardioides TaxID=2615069 RepID=UPI0006F71F8A|nr:MULTISPECIES: MATE family efflux transporter [unclassified Nocardioides]KRA39159.1 MATE family efflux transporter [Nocardioides sp. Root614]KRA93118.1 MATE family efflux transporter [Nocardioides sp. Root682]
MSRLTRRPEHRLLDREIARLAVPAFLALVAEPLFLLGDAAVVGHLGTRELAGLGIAGTVLATVVGLCVFLAYGTTASVARQLGAGQRRAALAQGIDGLWLAVVIGVPVTLATALLAGPLVGLFGASDAVNDPATTYLRIAAGGITPLLLVLATTGVLRGLQDTRTPLVVAVVGNLANIALNILLVYGGGPVPRLEIAGSALGSVIAQVAMAVALVLVVVRAARREGADLRPDLPGVRAAARAGVPLLVRTLTLRASLLVTTYAVVIAASPSGPSGSASDDAVPIATHQLALTLWGFLAFVLDAIAIAAQAITGRHLGAGDVAAARAVTNRMVGWGVASGVVTGVLLAASSPWLGALFTPDQGVRDALVPVLLVAAAAQPVAGVVFVLDGVLIGAGDGRYLAVAGLIVLCGYAPVVLLTSGLGAGLPWLWVVFGAVFMGGRLATLLHRAAGDRWLVTGAGRGR